MAACKPIEEVECKFFFRSRLKGLKICVTIAKFFHMIKQNPNEFIASSSVLFPFIILESSSMELSCCYVSGENTMETGEKQR